MKVCTDSCLFGAWVANKIEQKMISPKTILDIGTGTGLLSIMLAQKSVAQIHAIDIDKKSFAQASENFISSPWSQCLQAFHSDITEWKAPAKYDLIICNPPFYENHLLAKDEGRNISKHNMAMRLDDLLFKVKSLLVDDGSLAVLLPWARTKWFENAASANSLFVKEKMEVRQTLQHNYFRTMLLLQNQKVGIRKTELSIKNNTNEYTHEFIGLLKDYYLYL
ncbi:MAG: methyltransferase [Ginsengibacter sp.]